MGIMHVDVGGPVLEGAGKPNILIWQAGSNNYALPTSGSVSHECRIVFIRVGYGGALVSFADAAGEEKPYLIPPNYWREIVIAGGIAADARIVARNLTAGVNFTDLYVEVR